MDTFAALALATDPPTPEILNRKPAGKTAPLITTNMWKMIIGQAIFQLAVTFALYFGGEKIFDYTTAEEKLELKTMVFNTFVWMQIFNEFNNRRLDNGLNIFAGLQHNYFFIGINCIMIGAQIAIVFVGGKAFSVTRITGVQWAVCIVLAALSLPMAVLIRFFPDPWFARIAHVVGGPVAKVYRALGRFFHKLSAKLPSFRHAKSKRNKGKGTDDVPEGLGESTSVPEILVEGEKGKGVVDEEKGVIR
jgi:Ca2+-transporting ATPase